MSQSKIYEHIKHWHKPRNANHAMAEEQGNAGVNQRIAVAITRGMGTMFCAYIFAALALAGFPGFPATIQQYVQWLSQTFIQLTALSILAVGQSVIGKHAEIQADEAFSTTLHTFHDMEQVMEHLNKQDEAILEILHRLDTRGSVDNQ